MVIKIEWNEEESKGWTDFIPSQWFLMKGPLKNMVHVCRGPKGEVRHAICDVKVLSKSAVLDYPDQGPLIKSGKMTINFSDENRKKIAGDNGILWKGRPTNVTVSSTADSEDVSIFDDLDLENYDNLEGRRKLITHFVYERNPLLAKQKKAAVLKANGILRCEVCAFAFRERYKDCDAFNFCEVHHREPLSKLKVERETRPEHLAILCANCHRMIHRTARLGEIKTVEEFKLNHHVPCTNN